VSGGWPWIVQIGVWKMDRSYTQMKTYAIAAILAGAISMQEGRGQTALIYPTEPGTNLRDYSQPGIVAQTSGDTTTFYPTIPGTGVRDYFSSSPGVVARTIGNTTTFYPTLLSSGVPDYFSSSTSGFAARTSGDTTSFYPTIPGTGVRDYFNPTPSFAARTSGDTTTFYPTIPQTGVRDYFSSSPIVVAKTSGDTTTFVQSGNLPISPGFVLNEPMLPANSNSAYNNKFNPDAFLAEQPLSDAGRVDSSAYVKIAMELERNRNFSEALHWYERAADLGNIDAMIDAGALYECDIGTTRNYSLAMRWFQMAASSGDSDAMYDIGELYQYGRGVTPDNSQALLWYRASADRGNTAAIDLLKRFGNPTLAQFTDGDPIVKSPETDNALPSLFPANQHVPPASKTIPAEDVILTPAPPGLPTGSASDSATVPPTSDSTGTTP
jgi:hypothetical protein